MPTYERHDLVPDAKLKAQDGRVHSLKQDHPGRHMVLFFTDRVDDPDTGRGADAFNEHADLFATLNADIVGISADSVRGNRRLSRAYGIKFQLLADHRHTLARSFGLLDERSGHVRQAAVLVDSDGRIERIFADGSPDTHAVRAARTLKRLEREARWDPPGLASPDPDGAGQ